MELMVVVALVGIMLGVVSMSLSGLRTTTLSTASRQVADYINLCRSRAISKHTAIRFGVVVGSDVKNDAAEAAKMKQFSCWAWNKKTKAFEQLEAWQMLPGDLVFEPRDVHFIERSNYAHKDPAAIRGYQVLADPRGDSMEVDGRSIRFVQFSPTGRASVEGSEERNLILVIRAGESRSEIQPTNWAQFNIDTLTGRVRIYRP